MKRPKSDNGLGLLVKKKASVSIEIQGLGQSLCSKPLCAGYKLLGAGFIHGPVAKTGRAPVPASSEQELPKSKLIKAFANWNLTNSNRCGPSRIRI
jgi:hypothetical protein